MESERQHVAPPFRQFVQIGIRRRTGRTALRGEQLDHDGPLRGEARDGRKTGDQSERQDKAREHGDPPFGRFELLRGRPAICYARPKAALHITRNLEGWP